MASIHDEPEISPEEEEQMKKMARYRDHLIARTIERREGGFVFFHSFNISSFFAEQKKYIYIYSLVHGARARKEMVIARQVLPRMPLLPMRKLMEWTVEV
ncbi:hypothetical protein MKW92_039688, partial [Papaver armeniacum]